VKLGGAALVAAAAAAGVVESFDIQRHAVEILVDIAPEGLDHAPDKVLEAGIVALVDCSGNLEAAFDSGLGSDALGVCFAH